MPAVHDDGVILVFDQDHILGAASVHAAQADDFQPRAVVNDVGAGLFGVGLVSADTYWLAMRWASCWLRRWARTACPREVVRLLLIGLAVGLGLEPGLRPPAACFVAAVGLVWVAV